MDAIDEGRKAYHDEVLQSDNPYSQRSLALKPDYNDYDAWDLGWMEAADEELYGW